MNRLFCVSRRRETERRHWSAIGASLDTGLWQCERLEGLKTYRSCRLRLTRKRERSHVGLNTLYNWMHLLEH